MIKVIFSLCYAAVLTLNVCGAPKLPKYGSAAWLKLPGAMAVIQAAEAGDFFATYFLAIIAEEAGNPQQLENLLQNSKFYSGVSDEEQLAKAVRKFSDKGFYFAHRWLADTYFKMQLWDMCKKYWGKAAAQGDPVSQYNLGILICKQNKGKLVPPETVMLWKASAEQGYAAALKDMGLGWLKGEINGKADFPKAIEYLDKAAEKGNIQAMFVLGDLYERGLGGKVDKDLAIKYYKAAAIRHPDYQRSYR